MPTAFDTGRHTLILGRMPAASIAALTTAPRALRDGLRGQGSFDAAIRIASANPSDGFRLAANTTRRNASANGIAAIFTSPVDNQQAIGVISATQSHAFSKMAKSLTTNAQWQNLSGGVSRWDTRRMAMVQEARNPRFMPASQKSNLVDTDGLFAALEDFNLSAQDRFYGLKTTAASLFTDKREILFSRARMPKLSLPEYKTVSVSVKAPVRTKAPSIAPHRAASNALGAIPPLRLQRHAIPMRATEKPQFSMAYLKQNLAHKFETTRASLKRLGTKSTGQHRAMRIPSVKVPELKMPSLGAVKLESQSWNQAPLKSKGLLIGLVALMAFMLLGLAKPASSGRE
jgi:hypothetical protein